MKGKVVKSILSVLLIVLLTLSVPIVGITGYEVKAATRMNMTSKTLVVGQRVRLKVKGTTKKVTWSSSNKAVAKVYPRGKVSAKSAGTAIIKAKVGKKAYYCTIKVEQPVLSKTTDLLAVGQKVKLTLEGNSQSVVWKSSNKNVATVNKGWVKALAEGETTIKAVVGNRTYSCKITVWKKNMQEAVKNIKAVYTLVNQKRAEHNLSELKLNYDLCLAAMDRSKEISRNFSHTRPNGSSCFTAFIDHGIILYSARGENIASGYTTPKDVVAGWMKSAAHRNVMLNPVYQETGIGFYIAMNGSTPTAYWVQVFYKK